MKAYNITDVVTPELVAKGLVNVPIKLGDVIIPPGALGIVHPRYRAAAIQRFAGAIAIDSLPLDYEGKAKPQPTVKEEPTPPEEEPE